MKLSDIKGERTLEVIADLIEPIANIASDKEASRMFRKEPIPKGMNAEEFVISKLKKCVPLLLKEHKRDLIVILATLKGVSYEEYEAGMTLASVVVDLSELATDEEFQAFLSA